jgi:hypothetical protein
MMAREQDFHRLITSIIPAETALIGILNSLVLQLYMLTLGSENGLLFAFCMHPNHE